MRNVQPVNGSGNDGWQQSASSIVTRHPVISVLAQTKSPVSPCSVLFRKRCSGNLFCGSFLSPKSASDNASECPAQLFDRSGSGLSVNDDRLKISSF